MQYAISGAAPWGGQGGHVHSTFLKYRFSSLSKFDEKMMRAPKHLQPQKKRRQIVILSIKCALSETLEGLFLKLWVSPHPPIFASFPSTSAQLSCSPPLSSSWRHLCDFFALCSKISLLAQDHNFNAVTPIFVTLPLSDLNEAKTFVRTAVAKEWEMLESFLPRAKNFANI